jgi:hypothetical protein
MAAGVGITLTAASTVIFAELDWVPGNISQCEDRTHRIGQLNQVLIQHIVLEDSIDYTLANSLIKKQEIADAALDNKLDLEIEALEIPEGHEEYVAAQGERVKKAGIKDKPNDLEAIGRALTTEQIALIHQGVREIAGVCDGAHEEDGMGFNKLDSRIGKEFANQPFLTYKQAAYCLRLIRKYRRQLSEDIIEGLGFNNKKEKKEKA